MRFYHIFLGVSDMTRSLDFYSKAFENAKVVQQFEIDGNNNYVLDLGNGVVLEMLEFPPAVCRQNVLDVVDNGSPVIPVSGVFQHIAISFDSAEELQAQYDRMLAAGAGLVRPLSWGFKPHGAAGYPDVVANGAHMKGPDGEVFELCFDRK